MLMNSALGRKPVFALLIALFLVVNVGGLFTAEMMMEDGAMHGCPFMGVPVLCAMSPLEHLSEWQEEFATTAQPMVSALLLLAALAVWYSVGTPMLRQMRTRIPLERDTGRIFDPLRLAFARGILHSKAY